MSALVELTQFGARPETLLSSAIVDEAAIIVSDGDDRPFCAASRRQALLRRLWSECDPEGSPLS